MPVVRLTLNLRVARDPAAQRIVVAAEAVNAGELGSAFAEAVPTRPSADALSLAGPEILAGPWPDVQAAFLDRWWRERAAGPIGLETYASRTFRLRDGVFDPDAEQQLRSALDHHASCRLLCATRVRGTGYGAEDVNERLIARLPGGPARLRRWRMGQLLPGVPVMVQRSDFVRQLYNGDQGVVARVDAGLGVVSLAAVFARRDALEAFPLDGSLDLSPAFAMTVHKAQGSEFDHVAFVLPEDDMPMLTRELIYTAITRARRSVQIVGRPDLLARAVSRRIERHSGIAERLANTSR